MTFFPAPVDPNAWVQGATSLDYQNGVCLEFELLCIYSQRRQSLRGNHIPCSNFSRLEMAGLALHALQWNLQLHLLKAWQHGVGDNDRLELALSHVAVLPCQHIDLPLIHSQLAYVRLLNMETDEISWYWTSLGQF